MHSLAVDKDTHRVYVPEQEVDGRPAVRMRVYEAIVGQGIGARDEKVRASRSVIFMQYKKYDGTTPVSRREAPACHFMLSDSRAMTSGS